MNGEHSRHSPVDTFKAIEAGGRTIILAGRLKLARIRELMDEGEFHRAFQETQRLSGLLGSLGQAEQVLGYIGKGHIVSGEDIEVGMHIVTFGPVIEIVHEECEDCGGSHRMARVETGETLPMEGVEFVVLDDASDR